MASPTNTSILCAGFIVALLLQIRTGGAHVSLTFPPARLPNYDFLDNVRTGGPCGVPGERDCLHPSRTVQFVYVGSPCFGLIAFTHVHADATIHALLAAIQCSTVRMP